MVAPTELTLYVKQMSFTHPLPSACSLRVGRGAGVHIRVDDSSVSREHALLHVSSAGVEIEDLGSANGSQLYSAGDDRNARALKPGQRYLVASGDVVRIGSVPVLFQRQQELILPDQCTTPPPSGSERILRDPEMRRVYDLAARAAMSDIGVLITGETGVGKELLASSVHERSHRSGGPFVQLNCAAFAETLLESELFGHERGSFTGANAARAGLLESAQGGTVFLDEIGEMPLSTQAKMLRVLEEREIRRLGSNRNTPVDLRFVAATNRDLNAEVESGRFRGDLYYRISGITLHIPPLRARPTEVEPLARHFLQTFCLRSGIAAPPLTPGAVTALLEYRWPGNVRELKNAMERAPFLSGGAPIQPEHVPRDDRPLFDDEDPFPDEATDVRMMPLPQMSRGITSPLRAVGTETESLRDLYGHATDRRSLPGPAPRLPDIRSATPTSDARSAAPTFDAQSVSLAHGNSRTFSEDDEKQRVLEALELCSGNQTRAAQMLGVSRRTLINRIEAFGLPRPRKL